jgi:CubicO group peptidase (beta-lactamase class C family)
MRKIRWSVVAVLLSVLSVLSVAPGAFAAGPATVPGALGEKLDLYMTRLEGFGFSGALLVAKDGRVVLHKGYGLADRKSRVPFAAETVFDVGSITKQFTAAAILKLEMQGKLQVTDPISKYFDGVPEDKKGITLHHLLTHSAGVPDGFGGDYEEAPRDEVVKKALAAKLLWAPGAGYQYSNAGFSLLGAIVEIASGKPYEAYLQENLFKPAGMTKTGYRAARWEPGTIAHGFRGEEDWGTPLDHAWAPDGPWWNLRANGGILSTVGDLYKWHQALEGEAVLSKEAKAKLFAPHVRDGGDDSHYGYGWAIAKTPRGTRLVWHNGGNGIFAADFHRYVEEGVVIAIGSNQSDFPSTRVSGDISRLAFGGEVTIPPAVAKVEAKSLERCAGTYVLPSGARLEVSAAPADPRGTPRLRVTAEGGEALALLLGETGRPPEAVREAEGRLLAALQAVLKGDFGPLHQVYGADMPLEQVATRAKETWREMEERHGPFKRFEMIGTGSRGSRAVTYVRFQFENGTAIGEYGWEGPAVTNVRFLDAPPGGFFLPESSTELASFDPRTRAVKRIACDLPAEGPATAIAVRAPGGDVRARRVE